MYAQAGSFGPAERVYAALESLPWDQRGGRLIHFDIVHSEFKTKSRPLRGGVSGYLVGVDVGAGYAFFRSLKGVSSIGRAYREICVQQGWHTAAVAAHVVSDGENALVHHLETATLAMGQSFERFPPYSPNAQTMLAPTSFSAFAPPSAALSTTRLANRAPSSMARLSHLRISRLWPCITSRR
jgi:hypothetical protein